jgi:hypothetical protein
MDAPRPCHHQVANDPSHRQTAHQHDQHRDVDDPRVVLHPSPGHQVGGVVRHPDEGGVVPRGPICRHTHHEEDLGPVVPHHSGGRLESGGGERSLPLTCGDGGDGGGGDGKVAGRVVHREGVGNHWKRGSERHREETGRTSCGWWHFSSRGGCGGDRPSVLHLHELFALVQLGPEVQSQ